MSSRSKVVWSEGLFLRPQHFQQETRYLERYAEQIGTGLQVYPWGFSELKVDSDLLRIGKLALVSAKGLLPDGTPFDLPENDELPVPLDIDENVRDCIAYLCVPLRRGAALEIGVRDDQETFARYVVREFEAKDSNSKSNAAATMQTSALNCRLILSEDERSDYACLGVVRIIECRPDKQVVLDETFIPPVLDVQVSSKLSGYQREIFGLLEHRAEALAVQVLNNSGTGVSEISDLLLLQVLNRATPALAHLAALSGLHPENLYRFYLQLAGELATFSEEKRPRDMPLYRHDDLKSAFEPVVGFIRAAMVNQSQSSSVSIPLDLHKHGIRVGSVFDKTLFDSAQFILAVSASLPVDELQTRFSALAKVGAATRIVDLVNKQLPGIPVRPLAVSPRQLPFHAGHSYFQLDPASDEWALAREGGAFALHVGGEGEFPDLRMEFWAIRG